MSVDYEAKRMKEKAWKRAYYQKNRDKILEIKRLIYAARKLLSHQRTKL